MASTNHRTGLAVVVPVSDNRSQLQGIGRQNAHNSPHRLNTQSMNMSAPHQSYGTLPTQRLPNASSSWQQSNGITSVNQANGVPSSRPPSNPVGPHVQSHAEMRGTRGIESKQPLGSIDRSSRAVHGRPRLLGVEEALQYSPFSSIVPFSSGRR